MNKRMIDLTGQKFGRFTVLSFSYKRINESGNKRYYWLCRCDCGKEKEILSTALKAGHTLSCGCLHKETNRKVHLLDKGIASMRYVYKGYKDHAKYRNLSFSLSEEEFKNITILSCHYCGISPYQVKRSKYDSGDFIYNGIDRVDNSKGYEMSNVVPCCGLCNWMKKDLSAEYFVQKIDLIYEHVHGLDIV